MLLGCLIERVGGTRVEVEVGIDVTGVTFLPRIFLFIQNCGKTGGKDEAQGKAVRCEKRTNV